MYVCMYVCTSVTGLRLKYTGLCIVYVPLSGSLAHATHDAITMEIDVEDLEKTSPDVWKTLNCSTKQ